MALFCTDYVMLGNSVCTKLNVTTWFLYVYVHGSLVPDVIVVCLVLE